jgi:hypothetical protein
LGLGVSTGCYLVENRAFGSEFGGSGSGSYVCVLADYTFIIQQFLDPGISHGSPDATMNGENDGSGSDVSCSF